MLIEKKFWFLKLYIILIILIYKINGYDNCNYRCIDPGGGGITERKHIMCLRENNCSIIAERCSNYIKTSIGFDKSEKEQIVHLHNDLRNKIALGLKKPALPAASNMRKLVWHQELADVTQCYVNACPQKYKLNVCLDLHGAKIVTNEVNIAFSNHLENWVSLWFNEQYNFKNIYSNLYETSFPQLIWAETQYIGCGKIIYFSGPHASKMIFVVCSYLPGGKINGLRIYKKGKATTNCPDDSEPDLEYKGLCAAKSSRMDFDPHAQV